jgi:hypothetical protein
MSQSGFAEREAAKTMPSGIRAEEEKQERGRGDEGKWETGKG